MCKYLTEKKVYSLVAVLDQDGNTASPEDFKEVMAEQKKKDCPVPL